MAVAFWKDAAKPLMQVRSALDKVFAEGNQAGQSPGFRTSAGLLCRSGVFVVSRFLRFGGGAVAGSSAPATAAG